MNYKVYLTTKIKAGNLNKGSGIIVIETDDYSSKEIRAIKAKGYRVLGYLSVGTIEKERSWFNKYKHLRLQQLEDWPKEWYVDCTKAEWQDFLKKKSLAIINKGCDGLWCDNLDVYEYNKRQPMYSACKTILSDLKKIVSYVMVNGGSEFFDTLMDRKVNLNRYVHGVTQEEVFSRILDYSGKGKFGKQTSDQSKWYQSYMKRLLANGTQTFLLEYTRDDAVRKKIRDFCTRYKMTGYYISSGVDL